MAIVDEKDKRPEPILVDPFAGDIDALAEEQIDREADAYESVKPPRARRYNLKIVLAKNGVTLNQTQDGDKYYQAKLELYIVDAKNPEDNGAMVDSVVSTYMGRGKKINTMAYLMLKTGYPAAKMPDTIDHGTLLRKFAKWFQNGDKVAKDCLCDWQAWSKLKQQNVFMTEKDFPIDSDGEPNHIVMKSWGKEGSEELIGRLKRKDWGPTGKEGVSGRPKAPVAAAPKAAPKPAPKPPVEADDDDEVEEAQPVKAAPAPAKVQGKLKKVETTVDDALADID